MFYHRFAKIPCGNHHHCPTEGMIWQIPAPSFQNEVPKARASTQFNLHTGSAQKKVEPPLKLLALGDFSNSKETPPLLERSKLNISKDNFNSVLSEFNPEVSIDVVNALRGDGFEEDIKLSFFEIRGFEPEAIIKQTPQLRAMLAMRNLLRDLKSNLLDNAEFRRSLKTIPKDPALSEELRQELNALAPIE